MAHAGWLGIFGQKMQHRLSLEGAMGMFGSWIDYSPTVGNDASSVHFAWGLQALYHILPFAHVSFDLGLRFLHAAPSEVNSSIKAQDYSYHTNSLYMVSIILGLSIWK